MDSSKQDFPILERKINGARFVYLDSTATSQKPQSVLDTMNEYYTLCNANVHRGVYKISEEATEKYEKTRETIRDFIRAKSEKEIIYTRGTTESLNLIMHGFGEKYIEKGDTIVTTIMEHHSNFVPWQQLAKTKGAKFEVIDMSNDGELNEEELKRKIKGATLVAVTHASNVLGTINDVKKISTMAHEENAVCIVDGAQSVPHMPVDVQKIGCDFLAFSGHKMLGPTGIGILYGKEELLEKMDPFLFGGEMISEVHITNSAWNRLPYKFEAGTMPIAEVIGLGTAIHYLKKIGMENIRKHEVELTEYALKRFKEIKNVRVFGPIETKNRGGVISFEITGVHPHDIATVLDEKGIAIRSGHHCAMPLHDRLRIPASARASFYVYNTKEDVDRLIEGILFCKKIFKVV